MNPVKSYLELDFASSSEIPVAVELYRKSHYDERYAKSGRCFKLPEHIKQTHLMKREGLVTGRVHRAEMYRSKAVQITHRQITRVT